MTLRDAAVAVLDVVLVAYLIYRLLMLVRGTRAWRILVGIGIFVFLLGASERLGLATLHWVLASATPLGPVALGAGTFVFPRALRDKRHFLPKASAQREWLSSKYTCR